MTDITTVPAGVETQPAMIMPMPLSVDSAVEAFRQYQELRNKLGDGNDFVSIHGKEHPKKSWANKLSRFFSISIEILDERWDGEAKDRSCLITVRATMPNGMSRDATGACSFSEKRGASATVHNVRAHASTRAKNRAILELVGFGEVSAEELSEDEIEAQIQPVSVRTPKPTQTIPNDQIRGQNGNGKGDLDKARKATFALATEKGLTGKFTNEAFASYCYESFCVESRKELTIEQWRTLYATLRDDADIVDEIKTNGKRIEVEALIEDILKGENGNVDKLRNDIKLRLLGKADLDTFDNADMPTFEGFVETLQKLKDEGAIAEFLQNEPPF